MTILMTLLIGLLIAVVAFVIIDYAITDAKLNRIAKLILAVIFLIYLISLLTGNRLF